MTGVDRVAIEITAAIDTLLAAGDPAVEGLRVTVLVPPGAAVEQRYRHITIVPVGTRQGTLWEQLDLARAVPADGVLLNLCNTGPAFMRNQVVAIHDAGTERMPAGFSRSFRWWYKVLMPLLGRSARRIITVSQFSARELQQVFGIPAAKIGVIVESVEHIHRVVPDAGALQKFGLEGQPYLLAVSSMAAHKNFQLILDALALMDTPPFHVAIAGGGNARIFGGNPAATSDRVHWLGYVSDAELRALYGGARGFVFPSLYEGYGLPPLEAMACGCPVLASNAASIPEVCGDAALYFDPRDAVALKDAMLKLAGDPELRGQLSARGAQQAARTTWEASARQVLTECGMSAVQDKKYSSATN
ncbi:MULTISPECIES: glycosyltransferase family 1 protein [unclassified Duganella]|uniref:glycosyltransferase family 4 protein n=1 Tax=unclassified Duganella TaxID=2636909 RepID=UPI001028F95F|nr:MULTISPECIES: glycosyltransferase family 1 protein [unclassified Duganella]